MRASLVLLLFWAGATSAQSLTPPQQQQAQQLWEEIRCAVCEGQNLAQSRAPLAADMRALVVERLKQGDTPEEVRRYFAARYGEKILLTPEMNAHTLLLWAAPFLFILFGALMWLRGSKPA